MKYEVRELFKVKTSQAEIELQPGQVISLIDERAFKLLSGGKITPVEKIAYKVYSQILQDYLWVVSDEGDMRALRASVNVTEVIYTAAEISKLKSMDKEGLKAVHSVKEAFPKSTVENIIKDCVCDELV